MLRVSIYDDESKPMLIESGGMIGSVVSDLLVTINCLYKEFQKDDPKKAWAFQTALTRSLENPKFWQDDLRPSKSHH